MKKRGHNESKGGKSRSSDNNDSDKKNETTPAVINEDPNAGFSDWLQSGSGVEMMRLFVIANSLLVFMTMAWPNMQEAFSILKGYIFGEDDD